MIDAYASNLVTDLDANDAAYEDAEQAPSQTSQALVVVANPIRQHKTRHLFFIGRKAKRDIAIISIGAFLITCLSLVTTLIVYPWFFVGSATVVVSPAVRQIQDTRVVSDDLLGEKAVTTTTPETQSSTVATTGVYTQQATKASGIITLTSFGSMPVVVNSGAFLSTSTGIQFTTVSTVTVPVGNPVGQTTVQAQAVVPGTGGNVSVGAINQDCCTTGIHAKNFNNFSGGQDAVSYSVVAATDVQQAKDALSTSTQQTATAQLTAQLLPDQKTIGAATCTTNEDNQPAIGDKASSVTVTVKSSCSVLVYSQRTADAYVAETFATAYKSLAVVGSTEHYTVSLADKNTLKLQFQGEAYAQWTGTQLNHFAQLIASKSVSAGVSLLSRQPGVMSVSYTIWGYHQAVFPGDASHIRVKENPLVIIV